LGPLDTGKQRTLMAMLDAIRTGQHEGR
jgi:hypothetical protein